MTDTFLVPDAPGEASHDTAQRLPEHKRAAEEVGGGERFDRRTLLLGSLVASGTIALSGTNFASAASAASVQYVNTPDGKLAYRIDGNRNGQLPLLLLQRFRGTTDEWDPAFIAALAKNRQVIRFDSTGVGRSEGTTPDSILEMAKIVDGFVDALKLPEVDVLGWSMGGFIGQEFALLAPSKVRRLIIAGSGPGGAPEGPQADPNVIALSAKPVNDDSDFQTLFFADSETSHAAGRAYLARLQAQKNIGPATTSAAYMAQGAANPEMECPGHSGSAQAIGAADSRRERRAGCNGPILRHFCHRSRGAQCEGHPLSRLRACVSLPICG